eukprot:Clim_evm18s152 gene=Clim_evmTU18s152
MVEEKKNGIASVGSPGGNPDRPEKVNVRGGKDSPSTAPGRKGKPVSPSSPRSPDHHSRNMTTHSLAYEHFPPTPWEKDVSETTLQALQRESSVWSTTHPVRAVPGLFWTLFTALITSGYKWIFMAMRLVLFSMCLMPGFISIGWYYLTSNRIVRNVVYGVNSRNTCDIFLPSASRPQGGRGRPVVVYVTGGAWIIGYKAWGALMGRILQNYGIVCVSIDYRNFPQGTVPDMIEDVNTAVAWVFDEIASFGGDPERVYLCGQSAGAQLTLTAILEQVMIEHHMMEEEWRHIPWNPLKLKGYIGVSGPYDLIALKEHMHEKGLHKDVYDRLFDHRAEMYSPYNIITSAPFKNGECAKGLPPMTFLHGTGDVSVPHSSAALFAEELESQGAKVATKWYDGKTHTDLILEDAMNIKAVYDDDFLTDVIAVAGGKPLGAYVDHKRWSNHIEELYSKSTERRADRRRRPSLHADIGGDDKVIVPRFMIQLARFVNPF